MASRLARAYADADFIPALVHRLDKDTSGLLLAGKSYAAVRRLTDALAGREGRTAGQGIPGLGVGTLAPHSHAGIARQPG